jgi:hypothetical protein
MKKIVLMMVLCLVGERSCATSETVSSPEGVAGHSVNHPVTLTLVKEGLAVSDEVKTGWLCCSSKVSMHLRSAGDKALVIGGQFGKAMQTATPLLGLLLDTVSVVGVDVAHAKKALKIAENAGNLATLLVSKTGQLTFVAPNGTPRVLLSFVEVLLEELQTKSPQYVNLCKLLMVSSVPEIPSAFMPSNYLPGGDPTAATWTQSQKFLAWTAQLLSIYIQGSVTAEGPDSSGLITLTSGKGSRIQINTRLSPAPDVVVPQGYGFLKEVRMPDFISMLMTGNMLINMKDTPA